MVQLQGCVGDDKYEYEEKYANLYYVHSIIFSAWWYYLIHDLKFDPLSLQDWIPC